MIDFPVMVRSRKTSLNVTDKGIIVIQLELHPGNCLILSGEVCLTPLTVSGVFEADGDLGRGDNPQVHPGQPRPPAQVRVRGQHAAPRPMILWTSLKHVILFGGKNRNGFTLKARSQLCKETNARYVLLLTVLLVVLQSLLQSLAPVMLSTQSLSMLGLRHTHSIQGLTLGHLSLALSPSLT